MNVVVTNVVLLLYVATVPGIKAINNRTWRQYGFIKGKEDNQHKTKSFNIREALIAFSDAWKSGLKKT